MFGLDWFTESRDPFYVPDRMHERISLVGAGMLVAMPVIMWILLGEARLGYLENAMVVFTAGCFLVGGLRARAYRLKRTRTVAELRAGAAKHLEEWETP